jgi:hypothetical protein
MNLKYADAFAHEVGAVHLYILDSNNDVVWEGEDSGDALAQEGYEMEVDVQPGKYSLLAWCSTNHKNSFDFAVDGTTTTTTTPTNSKLKEVSFSGIACKLNTDGDTSDIPAVVLEDEEDISSETVISHELDDLYHGLLKNVTFSSEAGTHVITVPLTKDTNRVRVVLQHMSGEPIDANQFSFFITADNAVLRNDNSVVPENKVLYRPWYQTSVSTNSEITTGTNGTTKADADDVISVAAAELTTSRLVVEDEPRLTVVNNETNETVFSIPVKDYALMVKGYEKVDMDDQEYLDRQDEYNMTFFLDQRDRWISSYIYINSWKVVLQNSGL